MRGTILKRGTTYSIVFDLPHDSSEERRRKWVGGFKTKKAAEKALALQISEIDKGLFVEITTYTVSEYLTHWFSNHKNDLSPSTRRRYAGIIEDKIIPALGNIKLKNLKPLHIQDFINSEQVNGRKDNKKTIPASLSAATVAYEFRVLHNALQQAVDLEIINRNPADSVKRPRIVNNEVKILLEADVKRLLEATRELYVYVPIFLAIFSGMRLGEILGLRWQDVDLEIGIIRVNQSNCQFKVGHPEFKEPKTKGSRRNIDVGISVINLLKQHKLEQEKWHAAADDAWQGFDLVCSNRDGSPINPPNLSSYFGNISKRLKLGVTFHGLRHTHASLLLKAGVSPKVVSERLGHSSIAITMDVYSHVMPGMQREAANKIDELLTR